MTGLQPPHQVRLIGGQWKRSKLPVASAPGLRPTPDRVRETLFNWLGPHLAGWRCLDAFAGSGALGFEAASRGAAQVLLLEQNRRLADSLMQVKERLRADTVRIEVADALAWMARCPPGVFELILIDPPFDAELMLPAIDTARPLLTAQGLLYVESPEPLAPNLLGTRQLKVHRQSRCGAVHFHLLHTTPSPE